eukprot:CAMPEP_0171090780 /NCGR_PEP_ID=MMETSP0766_2-20121228/32059_1 /TAXON_ID=439317 /ORGANISM="Gambierdiscus australes, Strain CAWD 149" /LENGTH=66 /DNA_ID=CAMNT_0011548811 /DNA_START=62 /DNA_END=258 /DNA_ORIENTATION=-
MAATPRSLALTIAVLIASVVLLLSLGGAFVPAAPSHRGADAVQAPAAALSAVALATPTLAHAEGES